MTFTRILLFTLLTVHCASMRLLAPVEPFAQVVEPVIRQVDHILISSDDPESLFEFFAGTMQLPVAWPLADYKSFSSGGIGAGNVNLEVLRSPVRKGSSPAKSTKARYAGVAFEPVPLVQSLPQLKTRSITHSPPEPYRSILPDGSEGTSWTTVVLTQISKPGLSVFLCEYNPAFLNVEIRRNQLGGRLVLDEGGPLGIRFVKEIVVRTKDLHGERERWQRLFLPVAPSTTNGWQIGNGPAIRLTSGPGEGIRRIVLRVTSLSRARNFLERKQLLGAVTAHGITLNAARIQGLDILLVEQ
jgi:hypothetical protein